jgi:HD-like signal output (HDOD) protein
MDRIAYEKVLQACGSCGISLARAEEAWFGFNHAAIGGRLLARWGLPEDICVAVSQHHHPASSFAEYPRWSAAIEFSNCLAHCVADSANEPSTDSTGADPDVLRILEITPEDVPGVLQQLQDKLSTSMELLAMQSPRGANT